MPVARDWILLIVGALVTVPKVFSLVEEGGPGAVRLLFSTLVKCSIWGDHQFTRVRVNWSIKVLGQKEQLPCLP